MFEFGTSIVEDIRSLMKIQKIKNKSLNQIKSNQAPSKITSKSSVNYEIDEALNSSSPSK